MRKATAQTGLTNTRSFCSGYRTVAGNNQTYIRITTQAKAAAHK